MQIRHGDWVMVADGRKALFLENEGDDLEMTLRTLQVSGHDNAPTRDQGTDRPGRQQSSTGSRRSAYEETDWHVLEEARFAREIADALLLAVRAGRFTRLVLVAPPHALGDLRKSLHKEVTERIVVEINKDLTNLPPYEIERHLKDHA